MICGGIHLPYPSFCKENWPNQPNINIREYFTKWRRYNRMNITESCILPGCNGRYYDNQEAKVKHIEEIHNIFFFRFEKYCKIIQNTDYKGNCGICRESLSNGTNIRHLPNCTHAFHTGCVKGWLNIKQTCPICRSPTDYIPGPGLIWEHQSTYIEKIRNSNVEFTHIQDNQCEGITNEGRRCKRAGPRCFQHYISRGPPAGLSFHFAGSHGGRKTFLK